MPGVPPDAMDTAKRAFKSMFRKKSHNTQTDEPSRTSSTVEQGTNTTAHPVNPTKTTTAEQPQSIDAAAPTTSTSAGITNREPAEPVPSTAPELESSRLGVVPPTATQDQQPTTSTTAARDINPATAGPTATSTTPASAAANTTAAPTATGHAALDEDDPTNFASAAGEAQPAEAAPTATATSTATAAPTTSPTPAPTITQQAAIDEDDPTNFAPAAGEAQPTEAAHKGTASTPKAGTTSSSGMNMSATSGPLEDQPSI